MHGCSIGAERTADSPEHRPRSWVRARMVASGGNSSAAGVPRGFRRREPTPVSIAPE